MPFYNRRSLLLAMGLLALALRTANSAEITVPKLELASRGWVSDGEFAVSSRLSADLALSGGYKYSFLMGFSLEAPDLARAFAYRDFNFSPLPGGATVDVAEYNDLVDHVNDRLNNQAYIGLRVAKATVRELFGLPLELSYFAGADNSFCTGEEISSRYGLPPFGSDFGGFFYFPEGIGGSPGRRYDGIYGVRGTGFSLSLTKWAFVTPMAYLYYDFASHGNYYSAGSLYSGDLRVLFCRNWLRMEVFGGISFNKSLDTELRGGLMAHFSGKGVAFFAQAGIPGFIWGEKFSIDNLFFLFEPRLQYGLFGMHISFFYHPVVYCHIITPEERGKANVNLKFLIGKAELGPAGGIELGAGIKINGINEDFDFLVSPFFSFLSGGLRWDTKVRVRPLEFKTPEKIVDFFIGVRTAF